MTCANHENRHFLKCATHADNTTLKSLKGGIINVTITDLTTLSVNDKTGYLMSNAKQSWAVSTLLGRTTHFSNSHIRQICITPFTHGWFRFTSVLSSVFNQDCLYFQSWKDGITFGTSQTDPNGSETTRRRRKNRVAPIEGPIIPAGQDST